MVILCTIDLETREVSLPAGQVIASYDHNVDVIRFQAETIPGFSLNTSSIKIAAQGPNKARHDYAVDPSTVAIEEETGYITFDWPIPAGVTEMPIGTFKYGDKGQLIFAVCAEIISGDTVSKAWHSDDGIITVVAHLEPESGGGEDPEEEATNAQKIAQLQTDVAVINTQVGALGNGSPTPVATVAEMTDESTVYLYTGSETGHTAGNWYFWNGSAWTSGGTYGGATTSTTFNQHGVPADDFAVGQALAGKADSSDVTAFDTRVTGVETNLNGGIKTLNTSADMFARQTGGRIDGYRFRPSASTTRILSKTIPVSNVINAIHVAPSTGYKWLIYTFSDEDILLNTFDMYKWSETEGDVYIDGRVKYVRLLIANTSNSEILTSEYDNVVFICNTIIGSIQSNLADTDGMIASIGLINVTKRINAGWMNAQGKSSIITIGEHFVVNVLSGMSMTFKAHATNTSFYAFLSSYVAPRSNGESYDFCAGYQKTVVEAGQTVTATIPNGCNFLIVGVMSDVGSQSPQLLVLDETVIQLENGTQQVMLKNTPISRASAPENAVDLRHLYIGRLVQNDLTNTKIGPASSKKVSQESAIAVPYYGVTVTVKLPDGYSVGFLSGESTGNSYISLNKNSGRLTNGDIYTFTSENQIYRAFFEKDAGVSDISVAEVNALIASGSIAITYKDESADIIKRNFCNENYVKNVMRKYTGTLADDDSLVEMPTFTHLSDIHGDAVRFENFLVYSEYLNADAAIVSGDLVPMSGVNDMTSYIDDIIDKHGIMTLACMGNHDSRGLTTKAGQSAILAHIIDKYECMTAEDEIYPTYFYKDISAKNIRIISINQYEAGQYNTNNWRYTQEQIDWFIDVLASAPAGYGIVVVMHGPEVKITSVTGKTKFFQNGSVTTYGNIKPITQIVDAFIGRTSYSGSFEQVTSDVTETITIDADFTGVDASTEFICYMTGHRHQDGIGYVYGTVNTQLMCNVQLGFALYGTASYHYYAGMSDTARGGVGITQDAFNVYCVDRTEKALRIARVGSNINHNLEMRDYMVIPYAAT